MTDAERIELLRTMEASTRVLWFVVGSLLLLAALVLYALYQRREEAEENEKKLADIKRRSLGYAIERSWHGEDASAYIRLLKIAGADMNEVKKKLDEVRQKREMPEGRIRI